MKLILSLLITFSVTFFSQNVTYAESKKLENAFSSLNQLRINGEQAELLTQIKLDLKDAYRLSEKAQSDLLSCLNREGEIKANAKALDIEKVPKEEK